MFAKVTFARKDDSGFEGVGVCAREKEEGLHVTVIHLSLAKVPERVARYGKRPSDSTTADFHPSRQVTRLGGVPHM